MRSWLVDVVVYFLARQRRVSTFQRGARVLEVVLARDERFYLRKLLAYSGSRNWAARYLAARGLPRFYPACEAQDGKRADSIESRMRSLATDEDLRVREGIATGLAELGRSRFSGESLAPAPVGPGAPLASSREVSSLFRRWSRDPSEPMRRAILAATVSLVSGLDEEGLESLLDLWEGFLGDPSRTIRRELLCHGVGSALVERDPRFALRCLDRWVSWGDPQVDRQVSYLLLTCPLCTRYPHEVRPILGELAERYAEDKVQGSGSRDQGPARVLADARPELVERGRSLATDPCFKRVPTEDAAVIRIRVGLALRKQGIGVRDS